MEIERQMAKDTVYLPRVASDSRLIVIRCLKKGDQLISREKEIRRHGTELYSQLHPENDMSL